MWSGASRSRSPDLLPSIISYNNTSIPHNHYPNKTTSFPVHILSLVLFLSPNHYPNKKPRYHLAQGSSPRSYGINVARLAQLPLEVRQSYVISHFTYVHLLIYLYIDIHLHTHNTNWYTYINTLKHQRIILGDCTSYSTKCRIRRKVEKR